MSHVNVQAIGEAYASLQRDYPHDDWNELMMFAVADGLARSRATGEEWLTLKFGRHEGLNADWSVQAWRVCGQLWILDNEDGTLALVHRKETEDGLFEITELGTIAAEGNE